MDVDNEKGLEQLTWAIYDGVLLPGDHPELQGQNDWVQIIAGTYCLLFRGDSDFDHYPPCTTTSFDATQAARRATQQHGHTLLSRAMPLPRAPRAPALQSTVNVPCRPASSSAEGAVAASLDHHGEEEEDGPFHQFHTTEFSFGVPERKQKFPCIRWCIVLPPRAIKLTPCGEPPRC